MQTRAWATPLPLLLCLSATVGCGDDPSSVSFSSITVVPERVVLDAVGDTTRLRAIVRDGSGRRVYGAPVRWESRDILVARVHPDEGLVTARSDGVAAIEAQIDEVAGHAWAIVSMPLIPADCPIGQPCFGRNRYIEYVPGDLPLVVSAPHGGSLKPDEIRDRTHGVLVADSRTREVARAVHAALADAGTVGPHLIVSHLHRTKLDPNVKVETAAQGDPFAARAWREYHAFIERAEATVEEAYGVGFYVDLHGHAHEIPRIEAGYLLGRTALNLSDSVLDADPRYAEASSIRALVERSPISLSGLVRGPASIGALLEQRGYETIPSPSHPSPGSDPYFEGGYSTARHGSRDGGTVSGVQLELDWIGVRDTEAARAAFADSLAGVLREFLLLHYGFEG